MDDSTILIWIQNHLTDFRETTQDGMDDDGTEYSIFEMGWMDDEGVHHKTRGRSLRNCVINATNKAS
jgi:hypothetical protein